MNRPRLVASLTLGLLLSVSPACRLPWKRRAPAHPPTPIPKAESRQPPTADMPPPPKIEVRTPSPSQAQTPPPVIETESAPSIDVPPPKQARPQRKNPRAPEAAHISEPPQTPAAPAPQLGEMLPADQKREYARRLEQSLAEVRRMLSQIKGRKFTAEQRATLERIRTFLGQAETTREVDPAAAVNLAHRAELLARDLLRQTD